MGGRLLKIAHIAIVTPGRSGLYETTRELCAAERALGVDAQLYDPKPTQFNPGIGKEDRGAPIADRSFVADADIIVDHSGCDGLTDASKQPHIYVAHGRPRSSFLTESNGGPPVYSYRYKIDQPGSRYKAVVTLWPEHVPYLQVMFRRLPVHHVPACVDLKAWSPKGPDGYEFHGKAGQYNVVITDAWRADMDPFEAVNAVALAARKLPGTKLHIYGRQGGERAWPALLKVLSEDGTLGEVCGWVSGLDNVYRAADLMVTPHTIATRSVREAMACGCPVGKVFDMQNHPDGIVCALKYSENRVRVRQVAEERFDPLNTARAFLSICEGVLCGS